MMSLVGPVIGVISGLVLGHARIRRWEIR
jgi:hypothetical protein